MAVLRSRTLSRLPLERISAVSPGWLFPARIGRTALLLLFVVALAAGLWVAALPAALGRDQTPKEMIQDGLPFAKAIKSATKSEFLAAVCAAVRKHRSVAAAITEAAVVARRDYAGDIVGTVLRCSAKSNCKFVGSIVSAAISADRSAATTIADAAIATAPDCAEAIQNAVPHAANGGGDRADSNAAGRDNQNPLSGPSNDAGEGFDPHEQLTLVCDNGTQRTVRESQLDEYLHAHPGASLGSCPPTPTPATNK
jgi:hypothetical protein